MHLETCPAFTHHPVLKLLPCVSVFVTAVFHFWIANLSQSHQNLITFQKPISKYIKLAVKTSTYGFGAVGGKGGVATLSIAREKRKGKKHFFLWLWLPCSALVDSHHLWMRKRLGESCNHPSPLLFLQTHALLIPSYYDLEQIIKWAQDSVFRWSWGWVNNGKGQADNNAWAEVDHKGLWQTW